MFFGRFDWVEDKSCRFIYLSRVSAGENEATLFTQAESNLRNEKIKLAQAEERLDELLRQQMLQPKPAVVPYYGPKP
jgi:hypothetical protein